MAIKSTILSFVFCIYILHFLSCRREFFVEPNDPIGIDMMYNGGNFPFYEDKSLGVKILALPYKGLEVSESDINMRVFNYTPII